MKRLSVLQRMVENEGWTAIRAIEWFLWKRVHQLSVVLFGTGLNCGVRHADERLLIASLEANTVVIASFSPIKRGIIAMRAAIEIGE